MRSCSDTVKGCSVTEPSQRPVADVSVIIPVKDCAGFLEQCLDSVFGQTHVPREVICVDDGSLDDSLAILSRYASVQPTMRVVQTPKVGPGVARNVALDQAVGRYVLFVDADDFIEPTLIEQAVAIAEEGECDLVVWDIWFYNDRHAHRQYPPEGTFAFGRFDQGRPFSWRADPDWSLLAFQSWAWNKLFSRDFLNREQIRFQEIRRSEDVLFTCVALVAAERIGCVYDRLSNYRVCRAGSAMSTKDSHPLDFIEAFCALKAELERRGVYEELRRGYVSFAASSALYNLQTLSTLESAKLVFERLKDGGFASMGIEPDDESCFLSDACREECGLIVDSSFEEYSFHRCRVLGDLSEDALAVCDHVAMDLRREIDERESTIAECGREIAVRTAEIESCHAQIAELDRRIDEILNCAEWRVGSALGKIPRAIQRRVIASKEEGSTR